MTIAQRAGRVDLGDRIVVVADKQPLKVGEEYVLFLHWNQSFGSFEVMGPDGTFRLTQASINPEGKSVLAMSVLGQNQEVFLDTLRGLSK